MGTKDALKKRIQVLVELGVTQKAIATRMGMSQAAFSRWMNDARARISTDALDGFNAYADALRAVLGQVPIPRETQRATARSSAAVGERFRYKGKERRHENFGPEPGSKERRQA